MKDMPLTPRTDDFERRKASVGSFAPIALNTGDAQAIYVQSTGFTVGRLDEVPLVTVIVSRPRHDPDYPLPAEAGMFVAFPTSAAREIAAAILKMADAVDGGRGKQ